MHVNLNCYNCDFVFRVVDGIAIFKYWMPYKPALSKKPYQLVPSDIGLYTRTRCIPVIAKGLHAIGAQTKILLFFHVYAIVFKF